MDVINMQQTFAADEAAKDRILESARVALQERGVDMAQMEQTYNFLLSEAEAGRGDPNAAFDFVSGIAKSNGIEMAAADKDAIYGQLDEDFKQQQYVYALSNPEYGMWVDAAGNEVEKGTPGATFSGLKPDAAKTFNEFLNSSYYGPDGKPIMEKPVTLVEGGYRTADGTQIALVGAEGKPIYNAEFYQSMRGSDKPASENNKVYQQLMTDAPTLNVSISDKSTNRISGVPAKGSFVNVGGRLMVVESGEFRDKEGRNKDAFKLRDISTGAVKEFNGMASSKSSVNDIGKWAEDLSA
jgi:hypothetical protein